MRMRDLVERTGVPRTTIHHYLREGLLPKPRKTAANAAVYDESHIERLRLVCALRGEELGPHTVERVRSILALVDGGLEPVVASRLQGLSPGLAPKEVDHVRRRAASDVARDAGVSLGTVRRLIEAGLLVASRRGGARDAFDAADVEMARSYAELMELTGLRISDLAPVADLLTELVRYEEALTSVATTGCQPEESLRIRGTLERCMRAVHAYLIARAAVRPDA